jgi:hypothetical protein
MSGSFGASRVHTKVESPLGELTLVREGEQIAGLYFEHHWYRPSQSSFGPRVDDGFDTRILTVKSPQLERSETDVCSLIGNLKSPAAVNSLMPQFVPQFAVEAALS